MDIVVGENAYVSVEDADNLINSRLTSTDSVRKFWNNLDLSDKEIIILESTELFDTPLMMYSGRKLEKSQTLQFPRVSWSGNVIDVPDKIILGYLVQMISNIIYDSSKFGEMSASGVKSFADGSGARIEFNLDVTETINNKNSAGISKIYWKKYFKEFSMIV